jgi:hypothetical protein
MANFIVAEFKPLYIPFDYSFPPYKEYVPHVPLPFEPPEIVEDVENRLDDLRDRAPELFE